jgi:hypothetical protein
VRRIAWALAVLAIVEALFALPACGPALVSVDDPQFLDTAAKLAKCRAEGRAAGADAGADAGLAAYEACKKDAGL